jgi:hypothetical protein
MFMMHLKDFLRTRHGVVAVVLFARAAAVCHGQTTNYIVDQFDANTTGLYINQRWGTAVPTIAFSSNNAVTALVSNHPGSGSSQWVVPWTANGDQIEVTRAFNNGTTLNLNLFATVSFDIMFATNSATDGNGSYAAVEVDAVPQDQGWPSTSLAIYTSSTANGNGWMHVSLPVSAAGNTNLAAVTGIGFKIQQSWTGSNLAGTTIFWLDNIILSGFGDPPVSGPPQIIPLNSPLLWQRLEFQITNVPSGSNPFDPDIIRLDGTFTMPSGRTMIVPAFWYQGYQRVLSGGTEYDTENSPPQWRLRFTPSEPGDCLLSLAIQTNGQPFAAIVTNFTVASDATLSRFGYVGLAPGDRYFQTGDGQALPLNGEDVAWPSERGTYDYDDWFASMQQSGENFARVWMCPWSFGIEDAPGTLNNYALAPAWQLDYVLQLAEQQGIYLQLTLDYYGEYASVAGADDWPANPYNSANGGPCSNVNAFITNTTANVIYQKRLRYLVGRYGYSQNLLAWEFFNEIDNDYSSVNGLSASQSLNPAAVASWHSAMGNWMLTHDPFGHLRTTSLTYASDHPELWSLSQISFSSEHSYNEINPPVDLAGDAQYFLRAFGKPIMIGEFGTSWQSWEYQNNDPYDRGFREGIWGGALGGSTGTSMSWWWQNLDSAGLYYVYSSLGKILNQAGWGTGLWTNIGFQDVQPSANAIGLSGPHQSLIYLVATGAAWPNGATNSSLPLQSGQSVLMTNWPAGIYYADWYDPATATSLGQTSAISAQGLLSLPLPDYTVDLTGMVYSPPTLTSPAAVSNGGFQFQFNSEVGGKYTIEKSPDLKTWATVSMITNVQGTTIVSVPRLMTNSVTFLRARRN